MEARRRGHADGAVARSGAPPMAFDEQLAARIRTLLSRLDVPVTEQRMFGGLCFLVNGAMCCGVLKGDLLVRVGADEGERASKEPHARPFDFTGRPSKGMVYVAPEGIETEEQLAHWIGRGLAYAQQRATAGPTARRKRVAK